MEAILLPMPGVCCCEKSNSVSSSSLGLHPASSTCENREDLNDHDKLRSDPLMALLCGKQDVEGKNRRDARDRGKALAGKSTLNRLETAGSLLSDRPRYKKIIAEMEELEDLREYLCSYHEEAA
jgi:hypothetical protein